MAKELKTRGSGDFARSFITDGKTHVRREFQELGPAMKRTKLIQEAEAASVGKNPTDRHYIGSIPMVVLTDWLRERNYNMHDWAINAGGTQCPVGADPVAHATLDGGVKSEFLRYFLSRDFSKLHTHHVTTKRETRQFVVPEMKGKADGNNELHGAKVSGR
jgi:hypothetical protein